MNAGEYIVKEVSSDTITPVICFGALGGPGCCILESAHEKGLDKTSLIGIDPIATLKATGRSITIDRDGEKHTFEGDPYEALKNFAKGRRAFGFISYDAVRLKERIPSRHEAKAIPDFLFHLYRTVIVFDHARQRVTYNHLGTQEELDAILQRCCEPSRLQPLGLSKKLDIAVDVATEDYIRLVDRAKEHIRAGDIFQVVLSRTFQAKVKASPFEVYRAIRQSSPAPYLFFFEEEEFSLAGASPELLISVKEGRMEAVPIAGTRAIENSAEDLLSDPKECAEHVMLVDLARNDLGAVAETGSVSVTQYKTVQTFSHVHHIVSRVAGTLRTSLHPLDALKAAFPAGTLSGAPKIRAMQLIDELEASSRGPYGGAVVAIDDKGDLISCITIRMALIRSGTVEVRTGAGIVLDSDGAKEALETELKAKGILKALELAAGGAS